MRRALRRIVPPSLLPVARRVYEHRFSVRRYAVRTAIATALLGVLIGSLVSHLWPAAVAALAAALLVAVVEFRRLTRERSRLRAAAGALARGDLPAHLTPYAVRALVERGDVLDAYALMGADPTVAGRTDLPTRRRMVDGLQRRGYLGAALTVARSCPGRRDHRVRQRLVAEHRVLTQGLAATPVIERPPDFAPVPGRVLHIVKSSLPRTQAGYTIRTHSMAVAQAAAGLVPHVVTEMGYDAGGGAQQVLDGVTYHRVSGPAREDIGWDQWLAGNVSALARVVAQVRPAVLHAASDWVNALTARALADAFGLPMVYEVRGFWEQTWLLRQALAYGWDLQRLEATHGLPDRFVLTRDLEARCRREADHVVTLAEPMADRIAAAGVDRERITVVPNAVDLSVFRVVRRDRDLAARLGIAEGTVVIGYISSLNEYEGIDTLVDAVAKVQQARHTGVALLIVGEGPERGSLERRAEQRGLRDAIFTGRVPHGEVLRYYSLIDIFVVPRKPVEVSQLVTPLKPFEAMATGRTVVMSDVQALAAIAAESAAVELFEAGSVESLTATLTSLLRDDHRRAQLATAGAAWVREHRTWAANADRYVRLYAALGPLGRPAR